jgi:hypothetical protein
VRIDTCHRTHVSEGVRLPGRLDLGRHSASVVLDAIDTTFKNTLRADERASHLPTTAPSANASAATTKVTMSPQ